MANELMQMNTYLATPDVNAMLQSVLGERKHQFIVALTSMTNGSYALQRCTPESLVSCALYAAGLNLDTNPTLGLWYPVPYKTRNGTYVAQFQIGWKGLVTLALRTGKYSFLNVVPVYENQFISWNGFTEVLEANFDREPEGKVVGYVSGFVLHDGFQKTLFWSRDKTEKHARRYSKAYNDGPWQSTFDAMAMKTVVKQILKFGPMSSALADVLQKDQAVLIRDANTGHVKVNYIDNPDAPSIEGGQVDTVEYADKEVVVKAVKEFGQDAFKDAMRRHEQREALKIPSDVFAVMLDELSAEAVLGMSNEADALAGTPFEGQDV